MSLMLTPEELRAAKPLRFVTVGLAARMTGLSDGAIRKRIERGLWLEGREWRRGRDGRIWIDTTTVERGPPKPPPETEFAPDSILPDLVYQARKRAKKSGLELDISIADVQAMYVAQDGTCAVSGVPFALGRVGSAKRRPFAPSLDRIRSAGGYTNGNVRLVCCAVNYLMNEWGDEVFGIIADSIVRRRRR